MKTIALAIALLLGLASCKVGDEQANELTAPALATATDAGKPLPEALPQGFTLGFPYHFIKREIFHRGRKDARLRYTVEFLEGTPASIASSLNASAKAAGFTKINSRHLRDGRIHFIATKRGYGQLRAEIKPAGNRKLSNAAAKGTLVMGWPVEPATAKPATDAMTKDPIVATPATSSEPAQN
ncbi:hypothetical protein GCM10027084_01450 [Pseudoxanthomonas sangjuensis]|uniref:hypothetical protein n=1 Tax=Pseudoxanthomonas sangjuensis TaxID=1503750 RepID=UPI001390E4A0|nr:hypothetical protein [Pseudoxanthomonas sangjuensis]KAF1713958.1 hypothetical protein CSC71_06180 [Pseudoxanthomonas sangjuensis]